MTLGGASLTQLLLLLLLFILSAIGLTQQAAIDNADFYTAGVVEFSYRSDTDGWRDNLAGYLEIINSPNASATDIIVFPEGTLNDFTSYDLVPAGHEEVTPCLDDPDAKHYAEYLVAVSCAARNASKYIVINVPERQLCTAVPEDTRPCAANGYNIFNTNVVFDRNGTVISRYRKVHLYGEPRNTTWQPEIMTFETDFGVTFGHMICFDIMFFTPGQNLILEQGIRDFVYPTMWFSQLPFLTAVQVQQGWAYSNDVNLLAAGASRPESGSTGSGIFHGRDGTLSSVMELSVGQRQLYVSRVPKYPANSSRHSQKRSIRRSRKAIAPAQGTEDFKMKQDQLLRFETVELESLLSQPDGSTLKQEVCHDQLCCRFEIEWRLLNPNPDNNVNYTSYRLGAFSGWRKEDAREMDTMYLRNCGIFACTGPNVEDCGKLVDGFEPRVAFTRLLVVATYPKSQELLISPNSVLDNLLPLEPKQFVWSIEELDDQNQLEVRFALAPSLELQNLLTFGIYGDYYDDECTFGKGSEQQDLECGYKPKGDGAASLRFSSLLLFALPLMLTMLLKRH